jgi:hypothetical protein
MAIKDLTFQQLLVEMQEIQAAMMKHSRLAIMESSRLARFQTELETRAKKALDADVIARAASPGRDTIDVGYLDSDSGYQPAVCARDKDSEFDL